MILDENGFPRYYSCNDLILQYLRSVAETRRMPGAPPTSTFGPSMGSLPSGSSQYSSQTSSHQMYPQHSHSPHHWEGIENLYWFINFTTWNFIVFWKSVSKIKFLKSIFPWKRNMGDTLRMLYQMLEMANSQTDIDQIKEKIKATLSEIESESAWQSGRGGTQFWSSSSEVKVIVCTLKFFTS